MAPRDSTDELYQRGQGLKTETFAALFSFESVQFAIWFVVDPAIDASKIVGVLWESVFCSVISTWLVIELHVEFRIFLIRIFCFTSFRNFQLLLCRQYLFFLFSSNLGSNWKIKSNHDYRNMLLKVKILSSVKLSIQYAI